ncbi:MAG: SLC13 family permease, partial [Paracoccus sp. (in: a-proteobacteria)]
MSEHELPENLHQQGQYDDYEEGPGRPARTIWLLRAAGLIVAGLVWLLLGGSEGLSPDARAVAAIGALMAIWWMTEAIPLSATSLRPIVLIPMLTERTVAEATSPYASSIVFLVLGGFLIAIAMEKWNLHRRIALLTLRQVGVQPKRIILGMMLATGFLSMWVSNTATTLMMLPIALSILALVIERGHTSQGAVVADQLQAGNKISDIVDDPNTRTFGVCLVLSIAWSASIGGLGTLLGSPPNAIVAGYAADELGREIGFLEWMLVGVPLALTFILIAWVLMTQILYRFNLPEVQGGRAMIDDEIAKLGPLSQGEKMVLVVFCGAAFLWIVPGLLANIPALGFLGGLDDTAIAMEQWNLHRRLALLTQRQVGVQPKRIILGMMLATGFLSMWVSNTATTLMMLPIGLSILTLVIERSHHTDQGAEAGEAIAAGNTISDVVDDPNIRAFGICLVLSIAWAATIGGLGTLLGSPPNAIVAGYV